MSATRVVTRIQDQDDFGGTLFNGRVIAWDSTLGRFNMVAQTTNHAALANLAYSASGHTGFAGLDVANTFTQPIAISSATVSGVNMFNGFDSTADFIYFNLGRNNVNCITFLYYVPGQTCQISSPGEIQMRAGAFQWQNAGQHNLMRLEANGDLVLWEQTSNNERPQLLLQTPWVTDNTDATRKARAVFSVYDSAGTREVLRLEADGAAGRFGAFGAAAVARPSVTGSRGGNAALASLLAALASLGWVTDNSTA